MLISQVVAWIYLLLNIVETRLVKERFSKEIFHQPCRIVLTEVADYAFQLVRTDAIVDGNIYVGPAVYTGSASIVSKTPRYKVLDIEVTDVLQQFRMVTWAYLGIITLIVIGVCSFTYLALLRITSTEHKASLVWIKPAWAFWEILISQETFQCDFVSTGMTLMVAAVGTFFIITGYLLNFMSSDQVAKQPLPLIDSLEAQLSPRFREVIPTTYTNFFLYQKLLKSKPGTQLYDLDQLIQEKGSYIDAEDNANNPEVSQKRIIDLLDEIDRGKKTIISETVFWDLISIQMLCAINATKVIDVTVSETFNEGVLTFFFNKRLPVNMIRYLDYHARNSLEFSLTTERLVRLGYFTMEKFLENSYNTMRCYKRLRDAELDSVEFLDAGMKTYKYTFVYCACALAISSIALVMEMLGHHTARCQMQTRSEGRSVICVDKKVCVDYAKSNLFTCDEKIGMCFDPKNIALVDACLLGIYIDNDDEMAISTATKTPDMDPHTKKMPPRTVAAKDYTSFNKLYGNITGYEEPVYHIGRLPLDPDKLNTLFIAYDGDQDEEYGVNAVTPEKLIEKLSKSRYDRVFVVAHDFNQIYSEHSLYYILTDLLLRHGVPKGQFESPNLVIMVDWRIGAQAMQSGSFYMQAAANTILVGRQVGVLLYLLTKSEKVNIPKDVIHLIGYGLGAQVLHFAARWFTKLHFKDNNEGFDGQLEMVNRLTALDPMAAQFEGYRPLFGEWPHVTFLDARAVDVIITAASDDHGLGVDAIKGRLGMAENVAMFTFVVNGGFAQPDCARTMKTHLSRKVTDPIKVIDFCSHQMALLIFMYSLLNSANRNLLLTKEGRNWSDFIARDISNSHSRNTKLSYIGIDAVENEFSFGEIFPQRHFSTIQVNTSLAARVIPIEEVKALQMQIDSITKDEIYPELDIRMHRILQVPARITSGEPYEVFPTRNVTATVKLSPKDLPSCGRFRNKSPASSNGTDARIFRGQETYLGQFPWVACIVEYVNVQRAWGRACTASILNSQFILTAAHCVDQYMKGEVFYVTYGVLDCMKPPDKRYYRSVIVERYNTIIMHENFEDDLTYDVALIRLAEKIDILPEVYDGGPVNSICLHSNQNYQLTTSDTVYNAGFGSKGLIGNADKPVLTFTTSYPVQRLVMQQYHEHFYKTAERITSPVIDFFWNDEMHTTCGGDSGGPYSYVFKAEDDVNDGNTLDGIVSPYRAMQVSMTKAGIEQCDTRFYNDFTGLGIGADVGVKVASEEIYQWILDMIHPDLYDGEEPTPSFLFSMYDKPKFVK
ncbi:Hepatic triacylglycerol lipase [Halotydeus destructor]|nr:Hepatic triacylglycerol lipase [Halotydeus destructor]